MHQTTPHRIGFFVMPEFMLLDLSGPLTAFQYANQYTPYQISVVSCTGGSVLDSSGINIETVPLHSKDYDTLLIVGGKPTIGCGLSTTDILSVKSALINTKRIGSICTGAFLLAATTLLDGRRATTYWRHAAQLQTLYPKIRVDMDKIYVVDGSVWTSAGITAGIDLALAILAQDINHATAKAIAREMVVYFQRQGGQSQFSSLLELEAPTDRIQHVLSYAREHLHLPLTVHDLAAVAHLSPRQFSRVFRADTGTSPAKALERLRAEVARIEVEEGRFSLNKIMRRTGYVDAERMRRSFIRLFGQSPQALRRAARNNATTSID